MLVSILFAEPLWNRLYNGPHGGTASVLDIVMDNNYNVYITGSANSNKDGGDIFVVKYNAQGTQLWHRLIDLNYTDKAYTICIDEFGYSYVAGFTYDGEYYNLAVIKYNPDGTIDAINAYETQNALYLTSYTIKLDSQRNVYVATMYGTDAWLVTFDNNLNYRGSLFIDYGGRDVFNDMVIDAADRIFVTGRVETQVGSEFTDKDMFVGAYIFNPQTNLFEELWRYVSLPNIEYSIEKGHKIRLDDAGNVYVAGTTQTGSPQGRQHYCLWKFNASGNLQWMFNYNDPQDNSSSPCDLAVHSVTGISYMTGLRALNANDTEIMTMAIDSNMNLLWKDNLNYGSQYYDVGYAIGITSFSVYVSGNVGYPGNDDMVTICYRRGDGERKWIEIYRYTTTSNEIAWCNDVKQAGAFAYVVSAGQLQNPNYALTVMYKVLDIDSDNPAGEDEPMFYTQIYPHPCNKIMRIRLSSPVEQKANVNLYDATGRKIADIHNGFIKTGENEIVYNSEQLCNGVYFVRFDIGSITRTEKVVLQR